MLTSTGPVAALMLLLEIHYLQPDPRWRCRASHQRNDPGRSVPGGTLLPAVSITSAMFTGTDSTETSGRAVSSAQYRWACCPDGEMRGGPCASLIGAGQESPRGRNVASLTGRAPPGERGLGEPGFRGLLGALWVVRVPGRGPGERAGHGQVEPKHRVFDVRPGSR